MTLTENDYGKINDAIYNELSEYCSDDEICSTELEIELESGDYLYLPIEMCGWIRDYSGDYYNPPYSTGEVDATLGEAYIVDEDGNELPVTLDKTKVDTHLDI